LSGKDLATVKLVTEEEALLRGLPGDINQHKSRKGEDALSSTKALQATIFPVEMNDMASPSFLYREDFGTVDNQYDKETQGIRLTELERLKIVLEMCYKPKASWHKYSSTHIVLDQEAMVVQSRIFVLPGDGSVEEYLGPTAALDAGKYQPDGDVVRVYEIAYGSDCSSKAKAPTALYFDIPPKCIVRKNGASLGRSSTGVTMESYIQAARTKPFYIARPYDDDALALVVGILQLRVRELELPEKLNRFDKRGFLDRLVLDVANSDDGACHGESQAIYAAKMGLGSQFRCLVSHYATIYWDRCAERADKTSSLDQPVLNVESNYSTQGHDAGTSGANADSLWDTFVAESGRLFQGEPHGGARSSQDFVYKSGHDGPIPVLKRSKDDTPWYKELDNSVRCWRDIIQSDNEASEWEYARQAVLEYKEQHPTARPDSRASARSARGVKNPQIGQSPPSVSSSLAPSMMYPSPGPGTPGGAALSRRVASRGLGSYPSSYSRRPSYSSCCGPSASSARHRFCTETPMTRANSFVTSSDGSVAARSNMYAGARAYPYDIRRSPPVQEGQYSQHEEAGYY
jgi:hypothetical protein